MESRLTYVFAASSALPDEIQRVASLLFLQGVAQSTMIKRGLGGFTQREFTCGLFGVLERKLPIRGMLFVTCCARVRHRVWRMIVMPVPVVMICIVVMMPLVVSGCLCPRRMHRQQFKVSLAIAVYARVERDVFGIRVCGWTVCANTWQAARCCLALCPCAGLALHMRYRGVLLASASLDSSA